MTRQSLGLVTFRLERISINTGPEEPTSCPRCREMLDLSQPDPEDPDRLIGTCSGCGSWFLIEQSQEGLVLDMVALPCRLKQEGPLLARIWTEEVESESIQARA
jgi:hypothetical protein